MRRERYRTVKSEALVAVFGIYGKCRKYAPPARGISGGAAETFAPDHTAKHRRKSEILHPDFLVNIELFGSRK